MRYLSVCSGIEAASVAWHPLGWTPVAFAEIDTFPRAVLAHHYPTVPNWGDLTTFRDWPDAIIDVLVGGTPCQSFSVAGLRKGLDDPRGNLALTYLAVLDRYRPRWCCWENVPGVLSVDAGRAFRAFLGGLRELGYLGCYRVLDAQYFGLAQRRARVFVVGHLGDWRRAAAVLLERESLSGHPTPRRETGQVAPTVPARRTGGGGLGTDFDCDGGIVATLDASYGRLQGCSGQDMRHGHSHLVVHSLRADGFDASEDGTGCGTPLVPTAFTNQWGDDADVFSTLKAEPHGALPMVMPEVAFQSSQSGVRAVDTHATLDAHNGSRRHNGVVTNMAVRRLTPRECERLQGFPDDYTLIPYRGKPAADGPRYKALGNSMAVPCMSWIGRRIQMVDDVAKEVDRGDAA